MIDKLPSALLATFMHAIFRRRRILYLEAEDLAQVGTSTCSVRFNVGQAYRIEASLDLGRDGILFCSLWITGRGHLGMD